MPFPLLPSKNHTLLGHSSISVFLFSPFGLGLW
uniref:Uncharacterized protein n=1 Tax=Arundo donax TaxID=35708 RepID=A0A0A8ZAI0_ARUDO